MSNFSAETVAFYRSHLQTREEYAAVVGIPWRQLNFDKTDTKQLPLRQRRLLVLSRFHDPMELNAIDAAATMLVMVTVVLYLIFSTPGNVVWWPLLALSLAIMGSALLFRQILKRFVLPDVDEFLAIRDAAESDYQGTWNGIRDELRAAGLKLQEERARGRYLSNHGVVTLVTIDGELDYLVNGKVVQRPYSDLAEAS